MISFYFNSAFICGYLHVHKKNSCFCPFVPSPTQDIGSHCREINHKIVGIMDELIGKMIEKVITFYCHIREREGGRGEDIWCLHTVLCII